MDSTTFIITRDGDIDAFPSIERAALQVEGYDVQAGEYVLFCTVAGERFEPRLLDPVRVELASTGESATDELLSLLARHAARNRLDSDPANPQSVANELLEREHRRP